MLKPIAVALGLVQRDSCTIGDSVMIWKNFQVELTPKLRLRCCTTLLLNFFLALGDKKKLSKRIEQAMTSFLG